MGFELIVSSPHYARFKSTVGDGTFSVHAAGDQSICAGATVYFECANLGEQIAALKASGLQFIHDAQDQPWLWREARLEDPSGNVICLYHAGENRLNPPWRIKP
jgi:predicted enzyme related to lactoylglutathione lyase